MVVENLLRGGGLFDYLRLAATHSISHTASPADTLARPPADWVFALADCYNKHTTTHRKQASRQNR